MEPSLAAPPAAFEPLLDREMALSRAGGDIGLLREIAMLFLDNHAKWVAEIREAAECGDGQALELAAHGLKGSVANFGAEAAVEAALELEQIGRRRDLAEVTKALNTLNSRLPLFVPSSKRSNLAGSHRAPGKARRQAKSQAPPKPSRRTETAAALAKVVAAGAQEPRLVL